MRKLLGDAARCRIEQPFRPGEYKIRNKNQEIIKQNPRLCLKSCFLRFGLDVTLHVTFWDGFISGGLSSLFILLLLLEFFTRKDLLVVPSCLFCRLL
jgi:hypothetical protein